VLALGLVAGLVLPGLAASAPAAAGNAAGAAHPGPGLPTRPASCPALTAGDTAGSAGTAGQPSSTTGSPVWPAAPAGTDPTDYAAYLHTPATAPPTWPSNWGIDGSNWKLASGRTTDTAVNSNSQQLCGVEGNSVDTAWQTTTGQPTTVLAVLDSGIDWCDPGVVDKIALNRAALPPPENAAGQTKAQLEAGSQTFGDTDPYDLDGSGVLDVAQYSGDPRVAATAAADGGDVCATSANQKPGDGYTGISPEDLIRTFADADLPGGGANPYVQSDSGPAGFTEAIAGWNFVDNNDDPYDDVAYGHGSGEAEDMGGAAGSLTKEVGACPSCMVLPVRVGTSFITTGDAFAQGVLFAVDSGATVVSEALGTLDTTATDTEAVAYATAHGVPIVASAADEESEHPNLPASASNQLIVVNSSTKETSWSPASYLYLNGCTNDGPQISVTVESASCSSEATGKTSGAVGLAESAAAQAVADGTITDYPGLTSATGAPVPLSANEVLQLVTMSADDVDLATAAPGADPPAPADNYAVSGTGIPVGTTTAYPTTPGFDPYSGWGRLDAARMVQDIAAGDIPPEADITSPTADQILSPTGNLTVDGLVGAVRSSGYRYALYAAPGAAPDAAGDWHLVGQGSGTGSTTGALATVSLAQVAALFPGGAAALAGGPVDGAGNPQPDRFTFTLRLVVTDASGRVGVSQTSDFLHRDPDLVAGFPVQLPSSLDASPRLAPLGPGGENVLLVPEAGGTIHAYLPDGHELPGWPVRTDLLAAHTGEGAFTTGAVADPPRGEILGGVAVGALSGSGPPDVVVADTTGTVYAWNAAGQLLPGWPVHTDPAYSSPSARNADNRLLPGIFSAPSLADLTGDGQLDVMTSAMDRHVYAWSPSGQAVPGWPVLVIDPTQVQSVDPVTNQITFKVGSGVDEGTELLDTPAVGALSGSGPPDLVVGSDEEYDGPAHAALGSLGSLLSAFGDTSTANARTYALYPDGSDHAAPPGAPDPPGLPDPGAFLPGWPVQVADLDPAVLPTIGDGVTASPVLAHLTGGSDLDVVTGSTVGPLYALTPGGASVFGTSGGLPRVTGSMAPGQSAAQVLDTTIPSLGDPVVAPVGLATNRPSLVDASESLGRLLDEEEPGNQTPHLNQVGVWSSTNAGLAAGFPQQMNDFQFLTQPAVADLGGLVGGADVVQGSGLYDLRAYGANGRPVPGFPKLTGGWMVSSPAVGDWGTGSHQVLVATTREGDLLVWQLPTPACASPGPWAQAHHDLANTQELTAAAPDTCRGAWVARADGSVAALGGAPALGSMAGRPLSAPVMGLAPTPDAAGYWLVGRDGGVFAFGDAPYLGSMAGRPLSAPIVGLAPTPDGQGYWLVGRDGGVFAFGDAPYLGSMAGRPLSAPIVGLAPTPDGQGYWLVGRDGGVFAFGDAPYLGSMAGRPLSAPVAGLAAAPDGGGYWLVGRDGGVFAFGDVTYLGSTAGRPGAATVGLTPRPDGGGYWLLRGDGTSTAFGDAPALGPAPPGAPATGLAGNG
jgi:hypothetical protein